jgi:type IV pilus assembly protein PilQ
MMLMVLALLCSAGMLVRLQAQTVSAHYQAINDAIDGGGTQITASEAESMAETDVTRPLSERIAEQIATNQTELITLNYKDGDLRNILRLIARVSGVNLVAGPEVQGTVTIELEDVHWERALQLILNVNGYSYVREGNLIRVVSLDRIDKEPLKVSVVPVNYAKVEELVPVLRPLLTAQRGSIQSDSRANVLIITDIPSKLGEIERVVERLDQPTPQVLIEAKFIEIGLGENDDQGVQWNQLGDYGAVLNDMLFTFEEGLTVDKTHSTARGTEEQISQRTYDLERNREQNTTFSLTPDDFRMAISYLMSDDRVKLISQPKVQTLDNMKATIRVAENQYLPRFTYNPEVGTYEINDLENIYIGITLEVTPHINYNDYVTLDIIPEVSALTGEQIIQGVALPVTAVRRVATRVALKDKNTVAIGGMVRDELRDSTTGLPWFKDLPYVGDKIFSWKSKQLQTINLVVFITATIVRAEGTAYRWEKQLREIQVTPEGEFMEVITNRPSWHMVYERERQILDSAMRNGFEPSF